MLIMRALSSMTDKQVGFNYFRIPLVDVCPWAGLYEGEVGQWGKSYWRDEEDSIGTLRSQSLRDEDTSGMMPDIDSTHCEVPLSRTLIESL